MAAGAAEPDNQKLVASAGAAVAARATCRKPRIERHTSPELNVTQQLTCCAVQPASSTASEVRQLGQGQLGYPAKHQQMNEEEPGLVNWLQASSSNSSCAAGAGAAGATCNGPNMNHHHMAAACTVELASHKAAEVRQLALRQLQEPARNKQQM